MTGFISYYEWKAQELNRIFGHDSAIQAATVRHGEHARPQATTFLSQGISKAQLRRTSKRQWKGLRESADPP